jgi:hypothetical protein
MPKYPLSCAQCDRSHRKCSFGVSTAHIDPKHPRCVQCCNLGLKCNPVPLVEDNGRRHYLPPIPAVSEELFEQPSQHLFNPPLPHKREIPEVIMSKEGPSFVLNPEAGAELAKIIVGRQAPVSGLSASASGAATVPLPLTASDSESQRAPVADMGQSPRAARQDAGSQGASIANLGHFSSFSVALATHMGQIPGYKAASGANMGPAPGSTGSFNQHSGNFTRMTQPP